MRNPRVATRYAKSLLDLAVEKGQEDAVLNDMQLVANTCAASNDLELLLQSPVVKADKKETVLNAVFKDVTELSKLFMQLLTRKGRESVLPEVAESYIEKYRAHKNIQLVQITSAIPLEASVKDNLMKEIKEYTKSDNVEVVEKVNPELIGGFIVRVGDKQWDGSISGKLRDLKNVMLN